MKRCIGCKHLVAFGGACKGGESLSRVKDPLTGVVTLIDLSYPSGGGVRPSPGEMRAPNGRCGPDRKLYAPKLLARLLPWFYDS